MQHSCGAIKELQQSDIFLQVIDPLWLAGKRCRLCDNRSCVGYRLWSILSAVLRVSSLMEVAVNGTGVAAVKQPKSGSIGQVEMERQQS